MSVSPPNGVLIEITSRCNLTCRMCPLTAGETPSSHDPGNIDPHVWQEALSFAALTGRANVGGYGEPLSNQKCLTYLRDLDAAGVRISLTTNATMVNEKVARELAAIRGLVNVNVSMDSPDPETYRDIRGGDFAHAWRGLEHLARELGPSRLTVSSVMMRSNAHTLAAFPAKLAALGIRKYVLQGLVDYAPATVEEEIAWTRGLSDAFDRVQAAADAAGVEIIREFPYRTTAPDSVAAPPAAPSAGDTRQCFAPWDEPVVDKDGRVFPCCYAMTHGQAVLGNLKTESFEAVWHGAAFAKFRRDLVDGRTTPAICRQCTVAAAGPHVYREYSAELVPEQSRLAGDTRLRVVMRNTGSATWNRSDGVHIGTTNPRDRASAFHHQSWLGANRIGTFNESSVPPGGLATFDFDVTPSPAVDVESFQLVVEGKAWLPVTFELRPAAAASRGVFRRAIGAITGRA